MKRIATIFCTTALIVLMAACGNKQKFTVTGTVDDDQFDGCTVYLYNDNTLVDSAVLANGAFSFEGTVAEPWMGTVYVRADGGSAKLDFVVESGNISIDPLNDQLSGSPLNDSLQAFLQRVNNSELLDWMHVYMQQYYSTNDAATRASAERKYDSIEAIATGITFSESMALYNANKGNILGAYGLNMAAQLNKIDYNELNAIIEQSSSAVKEYQPLQVKLAQLKAIDATSVGRHYTDIQGVDGSLSDLIDGKLALVDFYASWCPPCRNEIRDNIVPLWAKYQKKGLVVVGLNVWERGTREEREAAHSKVMVDLGITYPQLVDSTRTATDTYGVRGIPQIMLIGPDGTILARDLRGAAIEEAIVKALAQ